MKGTLFFSTKINVFTNTSAYFIFNNKLEIIISSKPGIFQRFYQPFHLKNKQMKTTIAKNNRLV